MVNYYIDSCIWIDYFEDRHDRFRPLGEWAFLLLKKIVQEKQKIILSNVLMNELQKRYSHKELEYLFQIIPECRLLRIKAGAKNTNDAKELRNHRELPFADILHSVIAKENNAILVSRDRHFQELQSYIRVFKPEELI